MTVSLKNYQILQTAEQRWPKGIALGKLGVVHADKPGSSFSP